MAAPRHAKRRIRRHRRRSYLPYALLALLVGLGVVVTVLQVLGKPETAAPPPAPETVRYADEQDVAATRDQFGITYLEPTRPRGTIWVSAWNSDRSFSGVDPLDPWFDADHGSASYRAGGGQLRISGETPRMYVHDPELRRQWRDVEVTMYFKRVDDSAVPYAGMTAVARSNHLLTEDGTDALCDTRGYGGRLRFDGHSDFEKETAHPQNVAIANRRLWRSGMPVGEWIGYKYLVFDKSDGVHLELWLDETRGEQGGDWQLVNKVVDDGESFGTEACATGIDPRMALTAQPYREGSESGKPNVSVYFRSDGIAPDGLVYKWGSIREIAAR